MAVEVNVVARYLVTAPAEQVPLINCFLGGSLDEARMTASVDATLYRNRSEHQDGERDEPRRG